MPREKEGEEVAQPGYYRERLSGERLLRCYELASPRIRRYLEAEIAYLQEILAGAGSVLELGCGYGRVAFRLAEAIPVVVGIDNARGSLRLGIGQAGASRAVSFAAMDACRLGFRDASFDAVICVQNGICAFGADPGVLLDEALRVTRPGGRAVFSTYSASIWPERVEWFEAQAAAGLLGALDLDRTRDGVIVCRDGFRSGTFSREGFLDLARECGLEASVTEVDESCLVCAFTKP
ncbi:MAG: class I SAM-dependent methyltransferase [Candidatus Fermentibacter sp.]|nr:class I SAM-dependent methyltransferase [Candidatus Fermentibacter sp.]